MVNSTVTKFNAPETGGYDIRVEAWDSNSSGQSYFMSVSDSLIGSDEPPPKKPARSSYVIQFSLHR